MRDKFRNKYRIPSTRLQTWDYACNAPYFITICTLNREHYFGEIIEGEMVLSETGWLARKFWFEIPEHFPFVELGNFVVMPNHVHGILVFNKPEPAHVETPKLGVSPTIKPNGSGTKNKPGGKNEKWKPETLGVIINQYKRIVSIKARKLNPGFAWQPRFHDHIIRNEISFNRISDYIWNNPSKWKDDKFFN